MTEKVVYQGRDLEAMSFAVNYHRWILQIFKPYLGKRIVEVGAGSGSFSELILEHQLDSLTLVEPSTDMFGLLRHHLKKHPLSARLKMYNDIFSSVAGEIKSTRQPDSIIYVNVLEHISDDESELQVVHQTLEDSGRLFIFVPAMQWLYSRFDKNIGHFRRYAKNELENKCRKAGFKVLKSSYFDLMGIAPWLLKYRLMKSETMEPQAVQAYDKFIVPGAKFIETAISPPLGKNIILIAEKL